MQHDRMPLITEACRDDAEVLALSVLRFVAAGYMTSDVACWDAAHDGAERLLGPIDGPRLVAAMTGVMRAIRVERQGDWRFMPATCCRVTEDEKSLIAVVSTARDGGTPPELLRDAAALAIGEPAAPRLVAAAREAGSLLNRIEPLLQSCAGRRPAPARAPLH
jgi:hypothetical protein